MSLVCLLASPAAYSKNHFLKPEEEPRRAADVLPPQDFDQIKKAKHREVMRRFRLSAPGEIPVVYRTDLSAEDQKMLDYARLQVEPLETTIEWMRSLSAPRWPVRSITRPIETYIIQYIESLAPKAALNRYLKGQEILFLQLPPDLQFRLEIPARYGACAERVKELKQLYARGELPHTKN